MSFLEKLDEKSMEVFNEAAAKPFGAQAVFFLNAFWDEFGDQAEYIYAVAWHIFKEADMNAKGIMYVHKYEEGKNLDFDLGIYAFEHLCMFNEDPNSKWKTTHGDWVKKNPNFQEDFKKSFPAMQTSIVRKKELRDKVDVNFDGRVSFLEFLLYQYQASPKSLVERSMAAPDEDEAIRKAREALEEVNKRIQAYEAEKERLETGAALPGVKGLKMKNELAQLGASPLWEALNRALITAEAAVRIATRNAKNGGGGGGGGSGQEQQGRSAGAVWWMNRDLEEKQQKYGKRK
jgi:hypothetical protein